MTVYQLNGLDLPRHSRTQYDAGDTIDRGDLQKGDLVFFATDGHGKVSHVGIYIGEGQFIHAPSRGKKIRIDSLSNEYFANLMSERKIISDRDERLKATPALDFVIMVKCFI